MNKEDLRDFYQKNIYGTWRCGEKVSFECLGHDPKSEADRKNPFEVIGGDLVRISVAKRDISTSFTVHVYEPHENTKKRYPNGSPFIICMHPMMSADVALSKGYALIVMEIGKIASDDTAHNGAFYDLYPYEADAVSQTGVLMAWAWGASKVLDAVYEGLDKIYSLDANASLVSGVSRWGKATAVCGAFDERFRMIIPACSGAGGLALYSFFSEGKTYNLSAVGGPSEYTYGQNEPLGSLKSDSERGWFNDKFLEYKSEKDIPIDQDNLIIMAMDKSRYYFVIAAYMNEDWVNAPSMWECYKKADSVYEKEGLSDHLAVHFHKEGHAVIAEDMELIIRYFDKMYYKIDTGLAVAELKTTAFL